MAKYVGVAKAICSYRFYHSNTVLKLAGKAPSWLCFYDLLDFQDCLYDPSIAGTSSCAVQWRVSLLTSITVCGWTWQACHPKFPFRMRLPWRQTDLSDIPARISCKLTLHLGSMAPFYIPFAEGRIPMEPNRLRSLTREMLQPKNSASPTILSMSFCVNLPQLVRTGDLAYQLTWRYCTMWSNNKLWIWFLARNILIMNWHL